MITVEVLQSMIGLTRDPERVRRVIRWVLEARSMGAHLTPEAVSYTLSLFGEVLP